jgi:hypothetical protein
LRLPSPKIRFSSPKIQFSSHETQFTRIGFLLSSTAYCSLQRLSDFLQQLSAFSNGFPIFSNGFPIFLNGFPLSEKSEKSIYGEKYTKDCYSSFVFFATCSPSFVIPTKQYLRLTQQGRLDLGKMLGNFANDGKLLKLCKCEMAKARVSLHQVCLIVDGDMLILLIFFHLRRRINIAVLP